MLTDLAEAVRRLSSAEQLAARVAGLAHCPVCCAHCTSWRKLEDSRVLPRSPTDVPSPSGQRSAGCVQSIAASCKRKSFGGCNLAQIAAITMVTHAPVTGGGVPDASHKPAAASGTRPSRMDFITNMPLAGSPAVANRPAEAARCLESRASTRTRIYHPQYAGCGENLKRPKQAHTNTRPRPA